jgi:O-antigen/teichoic acid export membrane protein
MSGTLRIARNALWSWAGMATNLLVGFLVAPFLVNRLGQSSYGLWIVISSLTGYFSVLDFGIGTSVGLNVAYYRARNDVHGVSSIVSTAVAYLSAAGLLVLLATVGTLFVFFHLFEVPPDQVDDARLALLLVGANFAVWLPLNAFDGVLWACQRFDLQNRVGVPTVLVRGGLTFWLIGRNPSLTTLALITTGTTFMAMIVKTVLAVRQLSGLRLGPALVSREAARRLFGDGIWCFILSTVRSMAPQITLAIIGSKRLSGLGTALVTPFAVALRLTEYATAFLVGGTQVVTPAAKAMHARDEQERERSLFLLGGKCCLLIALFFLGLFAFLGRPLLRLWMGPDLEHAYGLLLILALGELLPMSQWTTFHVIMGKGRQRTLALLSLVEIAIRAGLAPIAAREYGLPGVCVVLAVPASFFCGVCRLVYGCRVTGIPVTTYLIKAMLPGVAIAAGPALALGLVTHWWTPGNWLEMFACGGAYAALFGAVAGLSVFGVEGLQRLVRRAPEGQHDAAPVAAVAE